VEGFRRIQRKTLHDFPDAIIASACERAGKPIAGFGALIAAACRSCGATLATRNPPDFEGTGIDVVDPGPWPAPAHPL
jgi:predicted nucleic acid-binding protein